MGIFNNKADEALNSKKKTSTKKVIEVNDPKFDKNFQKLVELKIQSDSITAQMDLIKSEVNPVGLKLFCEEYEKIGECPESFIVQTKSGATGTFISVEKYPKLTNENYTNFSTKYEGLVEEVCEWGFSDLINDPEIAAKVEKALIKALGEEMTNKLITVSKAVKRIKKGSMKKALTVGKGKSGKVTIPQFVEDLSFTHYFKDPSKG